MKKFKVTTIHSVYIDNFEQGEGKQVNFYTLDSEQKAETIRQAIEQHFNNTVYLPFEYESAEISEDKISMYWSNLVDEDNAEPSTYDVEKWKKGEKELYSNNIEIMIEEITPIRF